MCPLCLSALGWIAAGGMSSAGVGALIAWRRRSKGDDHDDSSDRHS
jgi:hypothetical protein